MRRALAYIGVGIGGLIGLVIAIFAGWGFLHIDNLIRGEEIPKLTEFALSVAMGFVVIGLTFYIIWAFRTLGERND